MTPIQELTMLAACLESDTSGVIQELAQSILTEDDIKSFFNVYELVKQQDDKELIVAALNRIKYLLSVV